MPKKFFFFWIFLAALGLATEPLQVAAVTAVYSHSMGAHPASLQEFVTLVVSKGNSNCFEGR